MIEFLIILLGGLVIGYLVSYSIYKNQYSADKYVSKNLYDEEKQHVLDLNEENPIVYPSLSSSSISSLNGQEMSGFEK